MSRFDRFESECALFYRYAYGVGETPSEKPLPTREERDVIASGECGWIGVRKADERIADVTVEASFTPVATRVCFVPVAEYRLLVMDIDAVDPDGTGSQFFYEIENAASVDNAFAIDGDGRVTVIGALDYELRSSYSLCIKVTEAHSQHSSYINVPVQECSRTSR